MLTYLELGASGSLVNTYTSEADTSYTNTDSSITVETATDSTATAYGGTTSVDSFEETIEGGSGTLISGVTTFGTYSSLQLGGSGGTTFWWNTYLGTASNTSGVTSNWTPHLTTATIEGGGTSIASFNGSGVSAGSIVPTTSSSLDSSSTTTTVSTDFTSSYARSTTETTGTTLTFSGSTTITSNVTFDYIDFTTTQLSSFHNTDTGSTAPTTRTETTSSLSTYTDTGTTTTDMVGTDAVTYTLSARTTTNTAAITESEYSLIGIKTVILDDGEHDVWVPLNSTLSVGAFGALEELFSKMTTDTTLWLSNFNAGAISETWTPVTNASSMTTSSNTTITVFYTSSTSTDTSVSGMNSAHQTVVNIQTLSGVSTDTTVSTDTSSVEQFIDFFTYLASSTYTTYTTCVSEVTFTKNPAGSDAMIVDFGTAEEQTSVSAIDIQSVITTDITTLTRHGHIIYETIDTDLTIEGGRTDSNISFSLYNFVSFTGTSGTLDKVQSNSVTTGSTETHNHEWVPIPGRGLMSIGVAGDAGSVYRGITLGAWTQNTKNTVSLPFAASELEIPLPVSVAQRGGVISYVTWTDRETDTGGASVFTTNGPSFTAIASRNGSSNPLPEPVTMKFISATASTATTNNSTFILGVTVDDGIDFSIAGTLSDLTGGTTGAADSTWHLEPFPAYSSVEPRLYSDFGLVDQCSIVGGRKAFSGEDGTACFGRGIYQLTTVDSSGGTSTGRTTVTDSQWTFAISSSQLVAAQSFVLYSITGTNTSTLAMVQTPRHDGSRYVGDSSIARDIPMPMPTFAAPPIF